MTSQPTDTFNPARAVVAAGVLFVDSAGRLMLVRPNYKPYWDIPGGYVEPGESPRDASVREVREELGLDVEVGSLLTVDWAPHPEEGDKVLFIFDGGMLSAEQLAAIRFQPEEIDEYTFVDQDDLDQFTIPRLSRRLRATLAARSSERPAYLQDGAEPAGQAA